MGTFGEVSSLKAQGSSREGKSDLKKSLRKVPKVKPSKSRDLKSCPSLHPTSCHPWIFKLNHKKASLELTQCLLYRLWYIIQEMNCFAHLCAFIVKIWRFFKEWTKINKRWYIGDGLSIDEPTVREICAVTLPQTKKIRKVNPQKWWFHVILYMNFIWSRLTRVRCYFVMSEFHVFFFAISDTHLRL